MCSGRDIRDLYRVESAEGGSCDARIAISLFPSRQPLLGSLQGDDRPEHRDHCGTCNFTDFALTDLNDTSLTFIGSGSGGQLGVYVCQS